MDETEALTVGLAPGNFCWPFDRYFSSSWPICSAEFWIPLYYTFLLASRFKVSIPLPTSYLCIHVSPQTCSTWSASSTISDGATVLLDHIAILDDIKMRAWANDCHDVRTLFVFHSSAGYRLVSRLFAQPRSLVIIIQRLYKWSSCNPTFHMPHADCVQPQSFFPSEDRAHSAAPANCQRLQHQ